jgi:large subunit ribosomal protein L25
MEEVTLSAELGRRTGSRPSGRLRHEGRIPAVVYGHGMDPLVVAVARRDLRAALTTEAGMNALINLRVDSDTHLTVVREMQRDPVRHDVTHIDFVVVRRDEQISADVPIVMEGEALEVKREQGLVEQLLSALTVQSTPGNIPGHLTVDVSGMSVGDTVRVADLALPAGVTTEVDLDEPVVVAQLSRAALEVEEAEEAAALESLAAAGVSAEDLEALTAAEEGEAVAEAAGEEAAAAEQE